MSGGPVLALQAQSHHQPSRSSFGKPDLERCYLVHAISGYMLTATNLYEVDCAWSGENIPPVTTRAQGLPVDRGPNPTDVGVSTRQRLFNIEPL
jgi:hypothetical protein